MENASNIYAHISENPQSGEVRKTHRILMIYLVQSAGKCKIELCVRMGRWRRWEGETYRILMSAIFECRVFVICKALQENVRLKYVLVIQ